MNAKVERGIGLIIGGGVLLAAIIWLMSRGNVWAGAFLTGVSIGILCGCFEIWTGFRESSCATPNQAGVTRQQTSLALERLPSVLTDWWMWTASLGLGLFTLWEFGGLSLKWTALGIINGVFGVMVTAALEWLLGAIALKADQKREQSLRYHDSAREKLRQDDFGGAAEDLTRAIVLCPTVVTYYRRRAEARYGIGDYAGGLTDWLKALGLDQSPEGIRRLLDAARWVKTPVSKRRDAGYVVLLEKAIVLFPDDLDIVTDLARYYHFARRDGDSLQVLNAFIDGHPQDPGGYLARAEHFQWLRRGEQRNYLQALDDLNTAIRLNGRRPDLYLARAKIHGRLDNREAALADYTHTINMDPANPTLWCKRAEHYERLGEMESQIADLTRAIEAKNEERHIAIEVKDIGVYSFEAEGARLGAFSSRARAYARIGRFKEAIADWSHDIEGADLFPPTMELKARAQCYEALGQCFNAIADLRRVVKTEPGDSEAHVLLAWLLATCPDDTLRNGPEALDHAFLANDPPDKDDIEQLACKAAAYAEMGQFERAVKLQEKITSSTKGADPRFYATEHFERILRLYQSKKPFRDVDHVGPSGFPLCLSPMKVPAAAEAPVVIDKTIETLSAVKEKISQLEQQREDELDKALANAKQEGRSKKILKDELARINDLFDQFIEEAWDTESASTISNPKGSAT